VPEFSFAKLGGATKSLLQRKPVTQEHNKSFENFFFLISKFAQTLYYLLDNTNLML